MPERPIQNPRSLNISQAIQQAASFQREGRLKDAERLYQAVLKVQPNHFDALHLLGVLRGQEGNREMAVKLISRALQRKPDSAEALANLGNALAHSSRHDEAIVSFDKALAIRPDSPGVLEKRGIAQAKLNRHEEAIASFAKALALEPESVSVLYNQGKSTQTLHRYEEAIAIYDKVLAMRPDHVGALNDRGTALANLKRYDEAIASYDKTLAIRPVLTDTHSNRGVALASLNRHDEAIASFDQALAIKPGLAHALSNRGISLARLNRYQDAIASFDKALAIRPEYADALNNRGLTLTKLHRHDEALANYNDALGLSPGHTDALCNRAMLLARLNRYDEAIEDLEKLLEVNPDYEYALGYAMHYRACICDWNNHDETLHRVSVDVRRGKSVIPPFAFLALSSSAADQATCSTFCVQNKWPSVSVSLGRGPRYNHERIRIAYLSADFKDHATAYLIAGLIERHDRTTFEALGVSFGHDSRSDMRSRLMNGFDQFIDVQEKSDEEIARLLRELEVDIAVDLKGFTRGFRTGIFAYRPAPIQVNYLGYPGTMGTDFIDYIIADELVIPKNHQRHYTEKVVYLPDCYQVNDSKRRIAERTPSRTEVELPQRAFVFCCFNNSYKITPRFFDVWMRLLEHVENSVLWLLADNALAADNLRREAAARGINPGRLVFAPRVKLEDHLARHRQADLFLDTLPYNAHTTASDALWAGLPVVTCAGTTFAGRVAGSLLHAIGLPDLVTDTLEGYEALALKLATDESLLRQIKEKLTRNRQTAPLFDTDRFRRHIEAAYTTMWEIQQRGEEPKSFAVPPVD